MPKLAERDLLLINVSCYVPPSQHSPPLREWKRKRQFGGGTHIFLWEFWVRTWWASCKRASIVCIVWAEVVFPQGSDGFVVVCLARRHVMCEEPPRRYKMKTTPKQKITQQRTRKTRRTLAVRAQGLVLFGSGHGKPLPGARYLPIRSFSARYLPVIYLTCFGDRQKSR